MKQCSTCKHYERIKDSFSLMTRHYCNAVPPINGKRVETDKCRDAHPNAPCGVIGKLWVRKDA